MSTHTISQEKVHEQENALDGLIQSVGTHDDLSLLEEHLQSARTYLLGAMPLEYLASLEDARKQAGKIGDRQLRELVHTPLGKLIDDARHPPVLPSEPHHTSTRPHGGVPSDARSPVWAYFSTADISFGVFYPKQHAIVTFPSSEVATAAAMALHRAGFGPEKRVTIRGEEMLLFLQELNSHVGLGGRVMSWLSQFFGTEESFAQQDEEHAVLGAAFLAIHCPTEQEFERVKTAIVPFEVIACQRYTASGIERI